ncbi:MAG: hypothetical protein Q9163_002746 [Psora crenata]
MPPKTSMSEELISLGAAVDSLRAVLESIQAAIQYSTSQQPPAQNPPNALALLSDGSKLLKAQTTKLSLLLINKPFTPSEITHILNTLARSVLPALMSRLELYPVEKYTRCMREHVRATLATVLREMLSLVSCIPDNQDAILGSKRKEILACTGVVWDECDSLVHLAEKGIVEIVGEQVGGYLALLEDAITELNDWDPDGDEEEEGDEDGDQSDEGISKGVIYTPTSSDEERLGMDKFDINLQIARKSRAIKYLRLVRLLYPALRKRRISTFPNISDSTSQSDMPTPSQIQDFDAMVAHTKCFTNVADEIAGCLYENDANLLVSRLDELVEEARRCVRLTRRDWNGKEDEYTTWVDKWAERMEGLKKG